MCSIHAFETFGFVLIAAGGQVLAARPAADEVWRDVVPGAALVASPVDLWPTEAPFDDDAPRGLAARACEVGVAHECISDPDDPCEGWCSFPDCECSGSGSCTPTVYIMCSDNSCEPDGQCRYNSESRLCDCVPADKECQNQQPDPARGSVACSSDGGRSVTENGHARLYVFDRPTEILSVEYAVEACRDATGRGNPCDVYVNVWHAPQFPQFRGAQLVDSRIDRVPHGAAFQRRSVQMNWQVVPTGNTVIEVYNSRADGFYGFWPGSNPDGEQAPSFIRAQACGMPDWTPLAQIGRPNIHYIQCYTAPQDDGHGGIPCDDLRKFKAKCKAQTHQLKVQAVMTDARHDGEYARFGLFAAGQDDGIARSVAIRGKKAVFNERGYGGNIDVVLLEPAFCDQQRHVYCGEVPGGNYCRMELTEDAKVTKGTCKEGECKFDKESKYCPSEEVSARCFNDAHCTQLPSDIEFVHVCKNDEGKMTGECTAPAKGTTCDCP